MNDASQPTRRAFLRGQAAAEAAEDALAAAQDQLASKLATPASEATDGAFMLSVQRRAMACDFEIQFAAARDDDATECALAALDLVEALEDQMTVYRDTSEVMEINRRAFQSPIPVEPRLFEIFLLAQRLYQETGGALDITSGPLSDVWGFSRRQGRLPEQNELAEALQRVGFHRVLLDESQQTISFQQEGMAVHLNCIGKGYALDRAADLLVQGGVENFLIQGGRSSVCARGSPTGNEGGCWRIGVRHPLRPTERLGEFCLRDAALATSGSATQSFRHRGQRYGHILDPRSGQPAVGIHSATVIAASAAEADALSTAFYVLGPTEAAKYCRHRPDLAALLVCPAATAGDVRLWTHGLDQQNWSAAGPQAGDQDPQ